MIRIRTYSAIMNPDPGGPKHLDPDTQHWKNANGQPKLEKVGNIHQIVLPLLPMGARGSLIEAWVWCAGAQDDPACSCARSSPGCPCITSPMGSSPLRTGSPPTLSDTRQSISGVGLSFLLYEDLYLLNPGIRAFWWIRVRSLENFSINCDLILLEKQFQKLKEKFPATHRENVCSYQCCGSGSGIRCPFDPWIPNPYFWELSDNFLGKKFYNSLKICPSFFLQHFKTIIIFKFVKFVAT
jgi:hypothetical protein